LSNSPGSGFRLSRSSYYHLVVPRNPIILRGHRTLWLTGEIRTQIDNIWNAFWTGGISNPLEVIEQITYLLFLRRLDDLHTP